jgi:hypothetical protein
MHNHVAVTDLAAEERQQALNPHKPHGKIKRFFRMRYLRWRNGTAKKAREANKQWLAENPGKSLPKDWYIEFAAADPGERSRNAADPGERSRAQCGRSGRLIGGG